MPLLVQHASSSATSGSTVTVTLGAGTTAGNCVPVAAGSDGSAVRTVSSIALGTTSDTFTKAESQSNTAGSADLDCEAWTDAGCSGGQTSVKVTFSGTVTAAAAIAMEWSGLATSGVVDTACVNGGNSSSVTSFSSGATGTLSETSAAVIGACWATSFEAPSLAGPSSPWTNFTGVTAGSDAELLVGYQVVSSSSSLTYSGSGTSFGFDYGAVIVPLKANVTFTAAAGLPVVSRPAAASAVTRGVSAGPQVAAGRRAAAARIGETAAGVQAAAETRAAATVTRAASAEAAATAEFTAGGIAYGSGPILQAVAGIEAEAARTAATTAAVQAEADVAAAAARTAAGGAPLEVAARTAASAGRLQATQAVTAITASPAAGATRIAGGLHAAGADIAAGIRAGAAVTHAAAAQRAVVFSVAGGAFVPPGGCAVTATAAVAAGAAVTRRASATLAVTAGFVPPAPVPPGLMLAFPF